MMMLDAERRHAAALIRYGAPPLPLRLDATPFAMMPFIAAAMLIFAYAADAIYA